VRAWDQGADVDVVVVVPCGTDVVEVDGTEVGTEVSGTVEVDGDEVERGFVDVVVEERSVDGVESGPPVGAVSGSVVDVVRGTVGRGVTTSTEPEDGDAGRTSRNSASVTTKIAPSITVDLRARPSISWRPAPCCWSRDRGR
jgi:hypothetical protein